MPTPLERRMKQRGNRNRPKESASSTDSYSVPPEVAADIRRLGHNARTQMSAMGRAAGSDQDTADREWAARPKVAFDSGYLEADRSKRRSKRKSSKRN